MLFESKGHETIDRSADFGGFHASESFGVIIRRHVGVSMSMKCQKQKT